MALTELEIQTRRGLCEDCAHSRAFGTTMICAKKFLSPCSMNSALKRLDAECPLGGEFAVMWKAAGLDAPMTNCQGKVEKPVDQQIKEYTMSRKPAAMAIDGPRGEVGEIRVYRTRGNRE